MLCNIETEPQSSNATRVPCLFLWRKASPLYVLSLLALQTPFRQATGATAVFEVNTARTFHAERADVDLAGEHQGGCLKL